MKIGCLSDSEIAPVVREWELLKWSSLWLFLSVWKCNELNTVLARLISSCSFKVGGTRGRHPPRPRRLIHHDSQPREKCLCRNATAKRCWRDEAWHAWTRVIAAGHRCAQPVSARYLQQTTTSSRAPCVVMRRRCAPWARQWGHPPTWTCTRWTHASDCRPRSLLRTQFPPFIHSLALAHI